MAMDFKRGDVEYTAPLFPEECRCGTTRYYAAHTAWGEERIMAVAFPAGIRPGDYVVVRRGGGPAQAGDQYGDLYVRVVLRCDPEQLESSFTGYRTPAAAHHAAAQRSWPELTAIAQQRVPGICLTGAPTLSHLRFWLRRCQHWLAYRVRNPAPGLRR